MDRHEILAAHCAATGKWGIYLDGLSPFELSHAAMKNDIDSAFAEVTKAAPWISIEDHAQEMADGHGWFFFDTEEEMERHYGQVVGDDGPTASNPYDGPARVYALTAGPHGLRSENT